MNVKYQMSNIKCQIIRNWKFDIGSIGNSWQSQAGFIAITTTLIISAVVLAIVTTVTLLAIGEAQSSFALFNGESTLQFVEGCVEDGLLQSRANSNYNGGTITRPEGTCSIAPITKVSSTWTMTVTTTNTQYERTIVVVFNRTGTGIALTSWHEQ